MFIKIEDTSKQEFYINVDNIIYIGRIEYLNKPSQFYIDLIDNRTIYTYTPPWEFIPAELYIKTK